jgi:RNA polymerase sigma-70 factor, ECF subfamily
MDKRHFERFYAEYVARIYKFVLYRVAGNRWVAEDLTQEIFLKAFEAFERYDPARSQVSWLYTIARNHVINHYAKQRPEMGLEEAETVFILAEDAAKRLAGKYDEQRMVEAFKTLSVDEARLVQMKYLEGWSFEDLAEIFGKSSGALRVQAGRVLKKIKQGIKGGI